MTDERTVSPADGSNGPPKRPVGERLSAFFAANPWVLYVLGLEALLVVAGVALDALAGALTTETELLRNVAGILGATSVILGIALVLVSAVWVILVLRASRTG